MQNLTIKAVSYTYPKSRFSLKDISLNIPHDQVTGILGHNGSGKSTLLRLIGGHLFPSKGQLFLGQKEITNLSARFRPIATVFQTLALFPHLSVKENILFPLNYQNDKDKAQKQAQLENLLETFQLTNLADRPATALSLGQQQRVAIARALATEAKILLLDEPTASLDYQTKDQLVEIINQLRTERLVETIIIVSHDRDFILAVCDYIALIEEGQLLHAGLLKEELNKPTSTKMAKALGVFSEQID